VFLSWRTTSSTPGRDADVPGERIYASALDDVPFIPQRAAGSPHSDDRCGDFCPEAGRRKSNESCASELFLSRSVLSIGMELITSLKRTGIKKYEYSQRRYGSSFPRNFNWELNLVHPAPGFALV